MLERNQLHPLVERVLAQARSRAGGGLQLEPTVLLHADDGWLVQAVDLERPAEARLAAEAIASSIALHEADAFVCLTRLVDVPRLVAALGGGEIGGSEPDEDGLVAVVAASRAGDRVIGTDSPSAGWLGESGQATTLEAARERLTALLLERA